MGPRESTERARRVVASLRRVRYGHEGIGEGRLDGFELVVSAVEGAVGGGVDLELGEDRDSREGFVCGEELRCACVHGLGVLALRGGVGGEERRDAVSDVALAFDGEAGDREEGHRAWAPGDERRGAPVIGAEEREGSECKCRERRFFR